MDGEELHRAPFKEKQHLSHTTPGRNMLGGSFDWSVCKEVSLQLLPWLVSDVSLIERKDTYIPVGVFPKRADM